MSELIIEYILLDGVTYFRRHTHEHVLRNRIDLKILSVLLMDDSSLMEQHLLIDDIPQDWMYKSISFASILLYSKAF